MPEITVRKRIGKRSGGWRYKSNRWFYRHRPQIAVAVAFAVFVLASYIIAKAMLPNLGVTSTPSIMPATPN